MELLLSLATFGVINLLAAISPGPDFLVVSKNGLEYPRKVGIATAFGVGCGMFVHVAYTIVGIGLIISKSVVLFSAIKLLGALYLCYLGFRLLRSKATHVDLGSHIEGRQKSLGEAFREGFLTNALNPKASVFTVSVFAQLVSTGLPLYVQSLYGIEAATVVFIWFCSLVFILNYPFVKKSLGQFQSRILKVMGAALLLLGVRLAFATNK